MDFDSALVLFTLVIYIEISFLKPKVFRREGNSAIVNVFIYFFLNKALPPDSCDEYFYASDNMYFLPPALYI